MVMITGVRRGQPKSVLELQDERPEEFEATAREIQRRVGEEQQRRDVGWLRQTPCESSTFSNSGGTPGNPKV